MVLSLVLKSTLLSEEQPEKAESPILITLSGMLMLESLLQPEKQLSGIWDIPSGSEALIKDVQLAKALAPML